MQCAKPLLHPEQIILREHHQQNQQRKENNQLKINADKEIKDMENIMKGNGDCEDSLMKAINGNNEK
eukprot:396994-Ditylum_brightwellii.AAC.1